MWTTLCTSHMIKKILLRYRRDGQGELIEVKFPPKLPRVLPSHQPTICGIKNILLVGEEKKLSQTGRVTMRVTLWMLTEDASEVVQIKGENGEPLILDGNVTASEDVCSLSPRIEGDVREIEDTNGLRNKLALVSLRLDGEYLDWIVDIKRGVTTCKYSCRKYSQRHLGDWYMVVCLVHEQSIEDDLPLLLEVTVLHMETGTTLLNDTLLNFPEQLGPFGFPSFKIISYESTVLLYSYETPSFSQLCCIYKIPRLEEVSSDKARSFVRLTRPDMAPNQKFFIKPKLLMEYELVVFYQTVANDTDDTDVIDLFGIGSLIDVPDHFDGYGVWNLRQAIDNGGTSEVGPCKQEHFNFKELVKIYDVKSPEIWMIEHPGNRIERMVGNMLLATPNKSLKMMQVFETLPFKITTLEDYLSCRPKGAKRCCPST